MRSSFSFGEGARDFGKAARKIFKGVIKWIFFRSLPKNSTACASEEAGKKHVRVLAAYEGITPEQFRLLYAEDKGSGMR